MVAVSAVMRNVRRRGLLPSYYTQAFSVACAQGADDRAAAQNEWVASATHIKTCEAKQAAARARQRYDKADHALKRALRVLRKVSF